MFKAADRGKSRSTYDDPFVVPRISDLGTLDIVMCWEVDNFT